MYSPTLEGAFVDIPEDIEVQYSEFLQGCGDILGYIENELMNTVKAYLKEGTSSEDIEDNLAGNELFNRHVLNLTAAIRQFFADHQMRYVQAYFLPEAERIMDDAVQYCIKACTFKEL